MPVARVFGIAIGLDYSWFLVVVLITWLLASGYYPAALPHHPAGLYWALGACSALLLFASVLLHELGHAVVALRFGVPVKRITLFVFGGVAEIGAEPPSAAAEFWIALAGPVVSGGLALLFGALRGVSAEVPALLSVARYLAFVNAALAVFNLVPGFPLDGGRIFRAMVWKATGSLRRATVIAAAVGRGIAFVLIVLGVAQVLAGRVADGLWTVFVGWFLESAAAAQVRQQELRRLLAGRPVSQAMSREYAVVPSAVSLQEVVDRHVLESGRRTLVVSEGEEMLGLLTLHEIRRVPRELWPVTTARQAMAPAEAVRRVRPDADLWEAMNEMDRAGVNQLPVTADGHLLGMLTREDVIRFLRLLEELGV